MNVLELCAGIGGLSLGLERAGMTVVGQVEIDPWCRSVLARHWPGVARHDDIRTTVDWWRSAERPRVDVVAGGIPCQPFSQAGKQLGVTDPRWLWPAMERVVRAVRPRFVILENVPGLVRDALAFGTILGDLSDLGFDAEWSVLSACAVGAPHRRRRVWVVAYPGGTRLEGLHEACNGVGVQSAAGDVRRGWAPEPAVARVADGVPIRLVRDPIHALGNAVVPAVAEHIGRLVTGRAA